MSATNQYQFLSEIHQNKGLRPSAINAGISFEIGAVENREAGLKRIQFGFFSLNEHVLCKEIMPCILINHANGQ